MALESPGEQNIEKSGDMGPEKGCLSVKGGDYLCLGAQVLVAALHGYPRTVRGYCRKLCISSPRSQELGHSPTSTRSERVCSEQRSA